MATDDKLSGEPMAFSPEEAAKRANCGRTMIFAEIKAGRLKARKLGRLTRILGHDLKEWLSSLPLREAA